jgi:pimeloyl-ACP methyl ester carboxylesterase
MITLGSGPPLVLIPGIQGRWEWMRPAVAALAERCRVITFSLAGDSGSGCAVDPSLGFDNYVVQIDAALDRAGLTRAALCGVSFGGLVAVHYAAVRPARVSGLVLASTPSPRWTPDRQVQQYMRAPRLLSPLFVLRSPLRIGPEIVAACEGPGAAAAFAVRHLVRIAAAPFSPRLMTERVRFLEHVDLARDCRQVQAPALVITGEPGLDRVVPVDSTRELLSFLPQAEARTLERTGHIGLITRPTAFAELVWMHVERCGRDTRPPERRRA